MRKAYSAVLSVLMCMGLMTFNTGCGKVSASQVISIIETQLPTDLATAATIAKLTGNAQLAAIFSQSASIAQTDLPIIQNLVATYKANQSAGNLSALGAAVSSLAGKLTAQVLAANKVADTQTDAVAVAVVAGLAVGINGWALALANAGAKSAQLATPQSDLRELAAIAGREQVARVAAVYGVSIDDLDGM
jgi:hypothetical protein